MEERIHAELQHTIEELEQNNGELGWEPVLPTYHKREPKTH